MIYVSLGILLLSAVFFFYSAHLYHKAVIRGKENIKYMERHQKKIDEFDKKTQEAVKAGLEYYELANSLNIQTHQMFKNYNNVVKGENND